VSAAPRKPVEPDDAPPSERPRPRASVSLDAVAARVREDLFGPLLRERRKLVLAAFALVVLSAAHVARLGTTKARIAAAALLAVAAVTPIVLVFLRRRLARDPRALVLRASPALGRLEVRRALANLDLAERVAASAAHEGVSPSLARLHAARSIARLDVARLAPLGERRGRVGRIVALSGLVLAMIVIAVAPARVVEGLDVAFARHGKAPLPLAWLDDVNLTIHPPAYLHQDDYSTTNYGVVEANRGAALIVRGTPRRKGRTLLLADDLHEVPFIDDGSGGVVAHWSVAVSGRIRVRARFGDVVIEEPTAWDLVAIDDGVPKVKLEGAPQTIKLEDAGPSIPLRYDAYDDHGLREVHLVLRIGTHEERRVLAKLDGEPRHDRGGYLLRTNDPLVKKARVPIALRVEARDNDPVTGPKWGKSAEIILVPPVVGAAEAARYEATRAQRDVLVDLLAELLETDKPTTATATAFSHRWETVEDGLDDFLVASFQGAKVPPRIAMILRGRMRKLRDAIDAEIKSENAATHTATRTVLEKLTTGLDEAMRAMAGRDTKGIAKTLAEVATDGADAVRDLAKASGPAILESRGRLDVDLTVLDGGGSSMRRLGELGRDLGEIVENDLRRVRRALDATPPDLFHAELALRDLAARLREPVPSFGGDINPRAPGAPTDEDEIGDESEGEQQAADEESALEELAKEHGGAIGEVEDLLRDAEDPQALKDLADEAKRRAEELRKAVAKLPKSAGMRKTLEAAEASAREKAEAMAEALEALQMGDARDRGDSAMKSLDEAKEKAWIQPGAEEELDEVEKEVQKQNDWIDDALKKLRDAASKKAESKVKGVAPREKGLEDKAKEIIEDSEKKSPLPEGVKELLEEASKKMDDASKKLEQGNANEGLKSQKEAQRLLEKARDAAKGEEEPGGPGDDGNKIDPDEKLDIPKAEDHKGPEAFRKRVLEGLGGGASSQKLQEAVRRYAEGLVK
jgi:hypothetical protein